MSLSDPLEELSIHQHVWQSMQGVLQKNRLPHALLFAGPLHCNIEQFALRLMALTLCSNSAKKACRYCRSCHLLTTGGHPDVHYIGIQEKERSIRIDVIRALQQTVYQTPQLGGRSFIIIQSADKMNKSAANALLKLLEEPPLHVVFILIAEQMGSILPTILSRCQKYYFSRSAALTNETYAYLSIGKFYKEDSERGMIFKDRSQLLDSICELLENKSNLCDVAAQWSNYSFENLLWFLYLLTAELIYLQLGRQLHRQICQEQNNKDNVFGTKEEKALKTIADHTSISLLFEQLQQIHEFRHQIIHNIPMNKTLAIEQLLLIYCSRSIADKKVI